MGGGGSYYDRDVSATSRRTSAGYTDVAQEALSRKSVDPDLLPFNRVISCENEDPQVYDFDHTGSMGNAPKVIYDKWPGIVGQIVARKYLRDPRMSIAATGDITSDRAPLQMADFVALRNLDKWFKRIYLEGNGGGGATESYVFTAYYYAYICKLRNKLRVPIYLITGDEAFEENLEGEDLKEHFGGQRETTTAKQVFGDLKSKFKDNVFLIRRRYGGERNGWNDTTITKQWEKALGKDHIVHLPSDDLAIGDITLGVYAVVSGARTVEQYLEDMRTRPLNLAQNVKFEPQSEERIKDVEKALSSLKDFKPVTAASGIKGKKVVPQQSDSAGKPNKRDKKSDSSWKV